jgi:hypothetical protein
LKAKAKIERNTEEAEKNGGNREGHWVRRKALRDFP